MLPLLILLAVAAGIAVALQGQFMGVMTRTAGTATSVLITYGVGAFLAIVIWLARRNDTHSVREIPGYAWFAGALGLLIVGGIGFAAPRLGLSRTLVISVAAQLLAAAVIDHLGLFGAQQRSLDTWRTLGLTLTVAGAWLAVK
jgi:bacterial/archaeal transporter family-2 protein